MQPARYHPALVALHWLLALMLLGMLGYGSLVLAAVPNSSPVKIDALRGHMIGGGLMAKVLMLAVVGHIAAALYHQFVRRDSLMARMGFGMRWARPIFYRSKHQ